MKPDPLPTDGSRWDAVVIGAGPAGCAAAASLCRLGLEVLLLERRRIPRWKVCGCCLEGVAVRALEDLGVAPALSRQWVRLRQLRIDGWGVTASLRLDGRALSRARLDAALAGVARDAGARVCWPIQGRLGGTDAGLREVDLRTPDGPRRVAARIVVGAWGAAGPIASGRRPAEAGARAVRRGGRIGVGATLPGASLDLPRGQVRMLVGDDGYVGLVRLETGELNVASCLRSAAVMETGGPGVRVAELFESAGLDTRPLVNVRWTGTPALRRLQPRVRDRLVTIGDAAGFWEPFTGEGIAWALDAGMFVAPALAELARSWSVVDAGRLARRLRRRMLAQQLRSRLVAIIAGSPPVARAALRMLRRAPGLGRSLRPAPASASGGALP